MDRNEIRSLIRSVLSEELGRLQNKNPGLPAVKSESISIRNDQDLAAFVKKLAGMCRDEGTRQELEKGQLTYSLGNVSETVAQTPMNRPVNGQMARFESGFINERQIDALSDDTEVVVATKAVRFTPLAKDRLRQRGIRIERKAS